MLQVGVASGARMATLATGSASTNSDEEVISSATAVGTNRGGVIVIRCVVS